MPKQRYSLDAANADGQTVERQILAYVRNGAFRHVAAMAAGIPPEILDGWTQKPQKRYRDFADRLMAAEAQARVKAEIEVFQANPRAWLREGPGKESDDSRGWTGVVRPVPRSQTQINVLADPGWNSLWSQILTALAEFPEARAALAEAMEEKSA